VQGRERLPVVDQGDVAAAAERLVPRGAADAGRQGARREAAARRRLHHGPADREVAVLRREGAGGSPSRREEVSRAFPLALTLSPASGERESVGNSAGRWPG